MKKLFILLLVLVSACAKEDLPGVTPPDEEMYFPPLNSATWETKTPEDLDWDETKLTELENYLELNGTRAFIILQNGRIVVERYWGNDLLDFAPFDMNTDWYWASAGKTLTAVLVGSAQEEGLVDINNKTSDYLGAGWTSMTSVQEDQIKVKHQLMMTTGLDYNVPNIDCTDDTCLYYLNDPETQWYYHNAPYTLLEEVVSNAAGISYNDFCDEQVEDKIGMDGSWLPVGNNNVYFSTARDAARFGLLLLANCNWNGTAVLSDDTYINQMKNTSQSLNPSYGYLTWLNGKSGIVYPGLTNQIAMPLAANAPDDLYAAMGRDGQFIEVVPSLNLVVIRMGEAPDNSLVPIVFHNEMWAKINEVMN